ncbi:MAG: hypothetical protein HQL95_08375 [Magnetococcales bacterium]|nr:hypothetical protein [Magnetococcales bacterium]
MSLTEAWNDFLEILQRYGCDEVFQPGLRQIPPGHPYLEYRESSLAQYFELLTLANGQRGADKPVFKSVSGWNKYERHRLLSLEESGQYYRRILSDQELVIELGLGFVPFSANGVSPAPGRSLDELFAIDLATGEVCLLWCCYADPFNPPGWQISCFRVAGSLAAFVAWQQSLYGAYWHGERMTNPFRTAGMRWG